MPDIVTSWNASCLDNLTSRSFDRYQLKPLSQGLLHCFIMEVSCLAKRNDIRLIRLQGRPVMVLNHVLKTSFKSVIQLFKAVSFVCVQFTAWQCCFTGILNFWMQRDLWLVCFGYFVVSCLVDSEKKNGVYWNLFSQIWILQKTNTCVNFLLSELIWMEQFILSFGKKLGEFFLFGNFLKLCNI